MELKRILKSKIFSNGVWLYVLQAFNTLIPLATLPYITRVLGAEQYGVFSKLLNIVLYAQAIVEYGFSLTGAKKMAIDQDQKQRNRIFTRIVLSKFILFAISLFLIVIFVIIYPFSRNEIFVFIILLTIVLSETIRQTWIFHGLQEMKFITIVTVISRIISVLLIFTLVKDDNDIYLYSALYAITYLLIGILSTFIVRYKFNIKFVKIDYSEIIDELIEGWYLFTSAASSKIFAGIGITVLTFTVSDTQIGMYSAIQKIPYMLAMAYAPIGQIIFPYISKTFKESTRDGLLIIVKITKLIVIFVILILSMLISFRGLIVGILYGSDYLNLKDLIIPLGIGFLFSVLNNLLGIQTLVASGYQKQYSIGFNLSTVILVVLTLTLGYIFGTYGVAYASMIAEGILVLFNFYFINNLLVKR